MRVLMVANVPDRDYFSSLSGLLTVMLVLLCCTVTSDPFLIASITVANVANAKSSPTLAKIEPSTNPIGGQKKDPTMRAILVNKQVQKAVLFRLV